MATYTNNTQTLYTATSLKRGDRLANIPGEVVRVVSLGGGRYAIELDWNNDRYTVECSKSRKFVKFSN